ncbi:hypothetical protein X797_003162 [Metarhizium robertsii]|uniref:Uncharacterized protein n=2 Tax=Metarhizium robertsii TaxID=568076 RepID=E9ETT5_METRA|nr:uncharacterized protein MAA_03434 [Metarhizium robertsii ARSEF 23]EFZ00838.1 hypothetical protein MAA_03434 [Metarhizium robertsii ARSEF 23]EXV03362.1 hypothetical protein X797_003162 [Metarhizium robertsii]
MKFIYASLLCAVVSAAPVAEVKRQTTGGAAAEGLSKALKATTDSFRKLTDGLGGLGALGGGPGGSKRDETPEAPQAGDVTVRLDQPAVDLSIGEGSGLVGKRQQGLGSVSTLAQTVSHAVLNGLAGGVLKRDGKQDPSKRQLDTSLPNKVLDVLNSGKLMEDLPKVPNVHIEA